MYGTSACVSDVCRHYRVPMKSFKFKLIFGAHCHSGSLPGIAINGAQKSDKESGTALGLLKVQTGPALSLFNAI